MDLKVILVAGAVMTAWVMLSLLSSERRRKLIEWEASRPVKTEEDEKGRGKKKI